MVVKADVLQIRNSLIVRYKEATNPVSVDYERYNLQQEEKDTTYSGKLSNHAKKRLQKAVTLLLQATPLTNVFDTKRQRYFKFHVAFVTLTVSSSTRLLSAKEAHKLLLKPFLLHAKRKWGVKLYVWKAELQKRGQIHYHITWDRWVHWQDIRDCWNKLQRQAGLLNEYFETKGHYDANSTDVHSVRKVANLEAYLIKYIAKQESEKEATIGKVWDCSQSLKKCNYFSTYAYADEVDNLQKLVSSGEVRKVITDYCELYFFKTVSPLSILQQSTRAKADEYFQSIGNVS